MIKKFFRKSERGQAIVIVALAMVGLIGIVGLMTDGGMLLIEYGKLKRGIDSASIAAASQFRRNFSGSDLYNAASEFLILNQSDAANITVFRCRRDPNSGDLETATDGTQHDEALCTTPRRKLLRVEATRTITFGFMRVLGINSTTIRASSVGEAASIDLVLAIDTSASMSYETGGGPTLDSPLDDPSVCNTSTANPCEPMDSIKDVARAFVQGDFLFFPYDRVAVVAMTGQGANATRDTVTVLNLSDSEDEVINAIDNLWVFQPPECVPGVSPLDNPPSGTPGGPAVGPCLNYNESGTFIGLECPYWRSGPDLIPGTADDTIYDVSSCNSSNIGGIFRRSAAEFSIEPVREDSFWAVIALMGGPANATDSFPGYDAGYCPPSTWNDLVNPFCRDALVSTRHSDLNPNYDADDYARDMADFLADPVDGQGVTVFTIGLGSLVQHASKGDPDAGERLLIYAAETAGGTSANHGFYRYANDISILDEIFAEIGSNIFTRLSQ